MHYGCSDDDDDDDTGCALDAAALTQRSATDELRDALVSN